jgi:hypothetical protein
VQVRVVVVISENLSTISRTWDPEDPGEESHDQDLLIGDSESEW